MLTTETRERVRSSIPWWLKCSLKLAMVPLPVGYGVLRSLSLARHGGMQRPEFALDAFRRHFDDADFHRKSGGFAALELGPGDALTTAVVAAAHGAGSICHVDVAPFATTDVAVYQAVARSLHERGMPAPDLSAARTLGDVLTACSARYETRGLDSLRALPDESIDFVFSNAVLQSIPRRELAETLKETRRVLHPRGVCVHSIDLRDMMGHSLNHLRFPERVWESAYFRRTGFHTNRLRFPEWMDLFRRAGFEPQPSEVNRWDRLPVRRESLAPPFRRVPEPDLLVSTIRVVLHPAGPRTATADDRESAEVAEAEPVAT